jgi:branched-chain amino acid transport system permease protein
MRLARANLGALLPIAAVLVLLVVAPYIPAWNIDGGKVFFFGDKFLNIVLTQVLWLGIAAASLIFLAGYGGMVSLAQTALYGISGFVMGNAVQADGGLKAAVDPWTGVVIAIAVTVGIGLVFGAVAARSEGIYFLMITLAFSVIVFYFWGAVTNLSGFGGLNNVDRPGFVDNTTQHPNGLYYTTLVVAIAVYAAIMYLTRTPFGLALQGIRDEPTRMRALGYNVALHRMLAFGFGALIAALAGILSVWWNSRIDPNSINLQATLNVLVIAVVGGMFRLAGAWVGAFVFVSIETYLKDYNIERFNTVIGGLFLAIVLLSPGGLIGIWGMVRGAARPRRDRGEAAPEAAGP